MRPTETGPIRIFSSSSDDSAENSPAGLSARGPWGEASSDRRAANLRAERTEITAVPVPAPAARAVEAPAAAPLAPAPPVEAAPPGLDLATATAAAAAGSGVAPTSAGEVLDKEVEEAPRDDEYYMARARELRALRAQAHAGSSAPASDTVQPVGAVEMGLDSHSSDQLDVQSASSIEMDW